MNNEQFQIYLPTKHKDVSHILNNGLIAQEVIQPKQIILQTQFTNIITAKNVKKIPEFKNLSESGLQDTEIISIYLLMLKQDNKFSDKYRNKQIDEWLKSESQGFIKFNIEQIRSTEDDDLLIQYAAYRNHMMMQSKKVLKIIKQNKQLIDLLELTEQQFYENYEWACQFRNTRIFGHFKQCGMMPYIDYMNFNPCQHHHKVRLLTWNTKDELSQINIRQQSQKYNFNQNDQDDNDQIENYEYLEQRKYIGVVAVDVIEKGQQIFFHYGCYSNKYLLQSYGFTVQNNPYDYVNIFIRKYWEKPICLFSAVERPTHKIKLRRNIRCQQLFEKWKQIWPNKTQQHRQYQIIQAIIEQLQAYLSLKNNRTNQIKNKYLKIYTQQQINIIQNQLQLWKLYVEQSKCITNANLYNEFQQ